MGEKILPLVHFIWVGPKPLPRFAKRCLASWRKKLPEWEVKLWRDEVFDLPIVGKLCRKLLTTAQRGPEVISEIARAKIVYHHGGFYADCDVELLRSVGSLRQNNEIVLGNKPDGKFGLDQPISFLFGFPKEHPHMMQLTEMMKKVLGNMEEGIPYFVDRAVGVWRFIQQTDPAPYCFKSQIIKSKIIRGFGGRSYLFDQTRIFGLHHLRSTPKIYTVKPIGDVEK